MHLRSVAVPLSLLALLAIPSPVRADRLVGQAAYARAQQNAERRSGGFIRYGLHITKDGILAGLVGAGAGYLLGGPGSAVDWGLKGATGGLVWGSATGGSKSGVFKHSTRAFAKADLAEIKGQFIRKHYYKVKGIVWSAVESGVVGGAASGALGLCLGGPAAVVPSALTGGAFSTALGAASGVLRAYVAPVLKRASMGWSLSRASSALKHLERDPSNPAWRDDVSKQLSKVQAKQQNIPRLSEGQSERYQDLMARAARLGIR
jgi:hypothetical protein